MGVVAGGSAAATRFTFNSELTLFMFVTTSFSFDSLRSKCLSKAVLALVEGRQRKVEGRKMKDEKNLGHMTHERTCRFLYMRCSFLSRSSETAVFTKPVLKAMFFAF